MSPHIRIHRARCSWFPKKGVPSAVVGTVRRWCQDYAAGLDESSTGEVPRLQNFCRHNCWVFAAPRKSKRQLTTESAECCQSQTRDGSRRPSREAPARTATGEPGMPLWTWRALGWVVNDVRVIPARYQRDGVTHRSLYKSRLHTTVHMCSMVCKMHLHSSCVQML